MREICVHMAASSRRNVHIDRHGMGRAKRSNAPGLIFKHFIIKLSFLHGLPGHRLATRLASGTVTNSLAR